MSDIPSGNYRIFNGSGPDLYATAVPGSTAIVQHLTGQPDQIWAVVNLGGGLYTISANGSNLHAHATAAGDAIQLSTSVVQWRIIPMPGSPGLYIIELANSQFDWSIDAPVDGAPIVLMLGAGIVTQSWGFSPA